MLLGPQSWGTEWFYWGTRWRSQLQERRDFNSNHNEVPDIICDQFGAYLGFFRIKRLGVFLFPCGWEASSMQGYPPPALNFPVPIYTPSWSEALRVVLPKNTTQCPQSGCKRTNHGVTASPTHMCQVIIWLCDNVMWFQSKTPISPLHTIESPGAQWLEHLCRSRGVDGSITSGMQIFFWIDAMSAIDYQCRGSK